MTVAAALSGIHTPINNGGRQPQFVQRFALRLVLFAHRPAGPAPVGRVRDKSRFSKNSVEKNVLFFRPSVLGLFKNIDLYD